ncbi:hypothetical protein QAD02_012332, partial [Eretmocerus hayati]
MESFEDEDDTHFCNKCHSTIAGLDNYVRHRQTRCQQVVIEQDVTEPNVSYPEILNADAFFSSLELQSSIRDHSSGGKTPNRRSGGGPVSELLEPFVGPIKSSPSPRRSCTTESRRSRQQLNNRQHHQQPGSRERVCSSPEPDGKEQRPVYQAPSLDADLDVDDDIGMPLLVGFPEIVATTSSSKLQTSSKPEHNNEMILTRLLSESESETVRSKHQQHHSTLDSYADYVDYHHDGEQRSQQHEDESNEESDCCDEEEAMGDDDSDSDSDVGQEDEDYPPRGYTGGKWSPRGIGIAGQLQHDDDLDMDDQHDHPPPSFTGGKWKPSEPTPVQPPPGHTRGKWVPGTRCDIGTGYWCSPCGRKLASRLVYNRHLQSDLHAKRSIQEIDGLIQMPQGVVGSTASTASDTTTEQQPHPLHNKLTPRQRSLALKRKATATAEESAGDTSSGADSDSDNGSGAGPKTPGRRHREKVILSCETCGAKVRRAQMGKHLLSHYHCRVAGAIPKGAKGRRFLLDNMANVVRQCPFQCAPCRFYCNTEDTFLRHWRSVEHIATILRIEGSFVCALCDFWSDDNEGMEGHLMKQGHQDVVSMMNGSVPIVIRRQRVLTCSTCCRRFRYNIQLRFHAKATGHEVEQSACDDYQSKFTCSICAQVLHSQIALQRHLLSLHKSEDSMEASKDSAEKASATPYFCSLCSLTFKTAKEAIKHRRTLAHKETVKMKKSGSTAGCESTEITRRKCPHCDDSFMSLTNFRQHQLENHPELLHRCPRCGERFALPQDLTRHTRDNLCHVGENNYSENLDPSTWRCTDCPFTSESEAEYLFHKALHNGPIARTDPLIAEVEGLLVVPAGKFQCPLCNRLFERVTLRDHLRKHTGERPFPCGKCSATFARRSTMRAHQKTCAVASTTPTSSSLERKYACNECGDAFQTKHTLGQHMLRHAGKQYKCGLPGCPTVLRTETELSNHRKLVHEEPEVRDFQCCDCPYAAKTKTQLTRHRRRLHNIEDPAGTVVATTTTTTVRLYKCHYQHCQFQTKVSSHLKRHFLLHTGKKPYKCRHCDYASNNV